MERSGGELLHRSVSAALTVAIVLAIFGLGGGLLLAASASAATPIRTSDPAIAGARITAQPEAVVHGWDAQAMRSAVPVPSPGPPAAAFGLQEPGAQTSAGSGEFIPGNPTGYPQRVHGRLLFKFGDDAYGCSGTVVNSKGRNIVFTAAHCVYDRDNSRYASEMVFVPAYQGAAADQAPLGVWAASAVFTNSVYVNSGDSSHDIAVVVLAKPIQHAIGSRKIAFDLDPAKRHYRIFGYPVAPAPPFDGNSLIGCDVQVIGRDNTAGVPSPLAATPCPMGHGASGGGWITDSGYLNSVTSYGYCEEVPMLCGIIYGPYFTAQAKSLYTYPAVGGSATPTVRFRSGPRGPIHGRKAGFTVSGNGSTPIGFRCRLDRSSFVNCGSRIRVRRLSPGLHVLRVKPADQTGKAGRTIKRSFKVLRRRR